jgi:hypothetical protein
MKNLKVALVSVVLALAMIGTAAADGIHAKNQVVKVRFEKAITIPGLAKAMAEQLDAGFLQVEKETYTCKVKHEKKVYYVTGTRLQWKRFFRALKLIEPAPNNFGIGSR